jgi:hypothetical protein
MRHKDKPRKQNPKTNKINLIAKLENRGNRSIREVSRDQHDLDTRNGEWRKVRNRMSWARNPMKPPERAITK